MAADMHAAIRCTRRSCLAKVPGGKTTHTMLYLDEDNTFSVEFPEATMKPLQEYCLSQFCIYKLQLIELTPDHVAILKEAARTMVGELYDVGQLLDISINDLLGFDPLRPLSIFDFGRKNKVCSVGVRAAFGHLYQNQIKSADSSPGKVAFLRVETRGSGQRTRLRNIGARTSKQPRLLILPIQITFATTLK